MRCRLLAVCALAGLSGSALAQELSPGEGPRLEQVGVTISQEQIESGAVPLREIRRQGRLVFSTPFGAADGYGDGFPPDPADPTSPGGRPTLQDNGTFLRVNGLDGQSCLECHSIVSHRTVPATFGIGGVGGAVTNAIFMPTRIDVDDSDGRGFAFTNGRFINPPFLFGSGGVQLLASEMTADLQALAAHAEANPGLDVPLTSKGIDFGTIRYVGGGQFDTSGVEGVDPDLVVRPFGRKGEFPTVRSFDLEALAFHFGMQAVEAFGAGDPDEDGIANEILPGEVSALEIFNTTLEPPQQEPLDRDARAGAELFESVGCADCHRPFLETRGRVLAYRFPEEPTDPTANVYYRVDLARAPARFERSGGGLRVPLFADLKRHDMGPELAESFGSDLDAQFTTARLWGVADTAPYLHDGRATTLGAAIRLHGGEAQAARDAFAGLGEREQAQLLAFLQTLRTPRNAGGDLGPPTE